MHIGHFEFHRRHVLVFITLVIAFTVAFVIRTYPIKYGFYLNEYDPYFNFRATTYLLDNGIEAYLKWHDTMSWYPDGRNVAITSQAGLHILTAFLYTAFGHGISLLDFTIVLPVIISSLTTVIIFGLVRTINGSHGTTAGMFAALLFAFSPILIQRGNLGWFKSEPFGLFFGLLAVYFFLSAIKHKGYGRELSATRASIEHKYIIPKAIIAGLLFGLGIASWGGTQYFAIPISLFIIALPFVRKRKEDRKENTKFQVYVAALFTISTLLSTAAFPRTGISSVFGLLSIALLGGLVFLAIANYVRKVSQPKNEIRNLFFLLAVFLVVAIAIIAGGLYYSPPYLVKYIDAINPFVSYLTIIETVAENSPPTLADYLRNFSTLLVLGGIGVWVILKRGLRSDNDVAIFALIIGISGMYVSTGSLRLLVFASIGIIILASIGLEWITRLVSKTGELPPLAAKTKTTARKLIKIKPRRFEVNNKRIIRFVYTVFIVSFLLFPMLYPIDTNWITLADIPPTIVNGGTGYRIKTNDWINALDWMSNNTPKDAVIAAWWDYGYWITVLANRTTLADNATINGTRVATIAQMFMDKPPNGINLAAYNLRADYILVYVVAEPIIIDNNTYYILGNGGDESKTPVFMTMAGLDEQKYIKENRYTTEFWNSTLIGKLIPFTQVGYTSFIDDNPTNLFQDYKPGAYSVYSKQIKYPKHSTSNEETKKPPSLVYSSDSFNNINPEIISAVLIYKIIK